MSDRLKALMEEIRRRKGIPTVYDFSDPNFPKQTEILAHSDRFQSWKFTRRFGKSRAAAKKGCNVACNNPGSKTLYLALTLDSAKGIFMSEIEGELESKNVPHHLDRQKGIFTLDNGSILRLFGVDSNYKEMKKLLGQGYDLVFLDESGSMTINVEELIMQMIFAALIDREGSLVMLGTAENIPNTFYQKVTEGKHKDLPWLNLEGSTLDSPYTGRQFKEAMDMILERNPEAVKQSWFRTHWLNEWCTDDDLRIISFMETRNRFDVLPNFGDWIYGLGVDLGFNDATSFCVNAMSSKSPYLHTVRAFKASGMDFTDTANIIKKLNQEYDLSFCEIDGANKQGVQEMQRRHDLGITLNAADKADKATFLRMMDDDYQQGKIKHMVGQCTPLETEQQSLVWLKDDPTKEDPRCENHLNDAQLYIWKKMRTYFKPEVTEWKPVQERMIDQFREEGRRAMTEESETAFLY